MLFPEYRPRRLRQNEAFRRMIRETVLTTNDFILPLFAIEGKDLKNSPLWKGCYDESEITDDLKKSKNTWYIYHIKFDGLKPIMITKTEEFKN